MSRQTNPKETTPAFSSGTFWGKSAADVERLRWKNQPLVSQISGALTFAAFLSFLPLFFWHTKTLLILATAVCWLSMIFIGTTALFGSRSTVLAVMWHGRQTYSETYREIFGRIMGAAVLAFMIFASYEILHGGLRAAYNNFGR